MALTPTTLREHARDLRNAAKNETDPKTKLECASSALLLAQLAEQLERTGGIVGDQDIEQYQSKLSGVLSDKQRQRIAELLKQGRPGTRGIARRHK